MKLDVLKYAAGYRRSVHGTEFVVLDLETTGLDPDTDHIIEVGALRYTWGTPHVELKNAERFDVLVDPGVPIPPDIVELTGIHDEDVAGAPRMADIRDELQAFLDLGTCFVAHNTKHEIGFLAAAGLDLSHLRILDTRDLVIICQPSLMTTALSRVAPVLGLPGGGHRAYADAVQTAEMLTLFTSSDYLGGLSNPVLLTILQHTPDDWPPRLLFLEELLSRGLEPDAEAPRLQFADFTSPGSAISVRPAVAEVQADPVVEEQFSEALISDMRGELVCTGMHPEGLQGVVDGVRRYAADSGHRVLVAVPSVGTGDTFGSLAECLLADGEAQQMLDPRSGVDLNRLHAWLSNRTLDDREDARDFGESRFLAKVLCWLTFAHDPSRRWLRFPTQHGMPTLALDEMLHWPSIQGTESSPTGDGMGPFEPEHWSLADTDGEIVVVEHALLEHIHRTEPDTLSLFNAIVVDDAWHLARRDGEREQYALKLNQIPFLQDRVLSLCGNQLQLDGNSLWQDELDALKDACHALAEGYASFLGGVPELVHNLRVWLMDSEYPLNLTLDSLQRMRPYKEFCSTHGQGLMERILTLRQCLRNLYGKLEPHHLADVRLVGEQITATANMLHPLLTGSTNNKEAVFWLSAPGSEAAEGVPHDELLTFGRSSFLPWDGLRNMAQQSGKLVMTSRGSNWNEHGWLSLRLGLGGIRCRDMNGRLDLDPVLCTTPKLAGSQTLEWLDNLCAELYPEDQGSLLPGCVLVIPPSGDEGGFWEPPENLSRDLVTVQARNHAPLAVRSQLLKARASLLMVTGRNLAELDLTGVDVRLVVVGKIPFSAPQVSHKHAADNMGIDAQGYEYFAEYTMPESMGSVQRLVDSMRTLGGARRSLVLLDPRFHQKKYGSNFEFGLKTGGDAGVVEDNAGGPTGEQLGGWLCGKLDLVDDRDTETSHPSCL